jgi:hypothetical protein
MSSRGIMGRLASSSIAAVGLACVLGCSASDPANGTVKCGAPPHPCPEGFECVASVGTCWRSGSYPGDVDADRTEVAAVALDGPSSSYVDGSHVPDATAGVDAPALDGPGVPMDTASVDAPAGGAIDAALAPDVAVDGAPIPDGGAACNPDVATCVPSSPPCEQRKTDDGGGLFVDALAGNDADPNGCGSRTRPCQTITKGMARASGLKSVVYVAVGTYAEAIVLAAGLEVQGGWASASGAWVPVCDTSAATVLAPAPAAANTTVLARDLAKASTLSYLTILTRNAKDGESVYGVMATGKTTKLTLDHVLVKAASGGNGTAGRQGAPVGNGAPSGCATPGDGLPPTVAALTGGGAPAGSFTSLGYQAALAVAGAEGPAGHNGTAGGAGQSKLTYTCKSASSSECTSATVKGEDGKAGCGGDGGHGGQPGGSGGSSIALFVWDARVDVLGGLLQAGNGGVGGKGGAGGDPGIGMPGVAGAEKPLASCHTPCIQTGSYGTCSAYSCDNPITGAAAGGSPGGAGSNGGRGGEGGAGAGGFSYAVFKGGVATVARVGTQLVSGIAGTSLGNGALGDAKAEHP